MSNGIDRVYPVSNGAAAGLLGPQDQHPVNIVNPGGASPFLLIGDHAGNAVPKRLGRLGLDDAELRRHIGWDIGVAALGTALSATLNATFIHQNYSRLVVDCNRRPEAPDAIPESSDLTLVPGNVGLSENERAERLAAIHEPYQLAIAGELAQRDAAGVATILIALHSFTPMMQQVARPWHIGVLHDAGNTRFAHTFLAMLRSDASLIVGDNEPYRMDLIDYTIPRHAYPGRRPYAEIEVRQDMLAADNGAAVWSAILAAKLTAAKDAFALSYLAR